MKQLSRASRSWFRGASAPALLALAVLVQLAAPAPVRAVQVGGLYDFDTLVTSRGAEERAKAAHRGLSQVLLRVSGSRDTLTAPPVLDALERAEELLIQARYESTPYKLQDETGTEVPADRLRMVFSASAVQQLLRNAGLPVWGDNRPPVLAWVVAPRDEGDMFVSGPADGEAGEWLQAHAARRGIPVQFPLLDLTDQFALDARQVSQLQEAPLRTASARYGADHVLAGMLTRTAVAWSARWVALVRGESFVFQTTGDSLDALTGDAIDILADRMAVRYAVRAAQVGGTRVRMTVDAVADVATYAQVGELLRALTPVKAVDIVSVRGSTSVWLLDIEGTHRQFLDLLALKPQFSEVVPAQADSEHLWRLHYRFRR